MLARAARCQRAALSGGGQGFDFLRCRPGVVYDIGCSIPRSARFSASSFFSRVCRLHPLCGVTSCPSGPVIASDSRRDNSSRLVRFPARPARRCSPGLPSVDARPPTSPAAISSPCFLAILSTLLRMALRSSSSVTSWLPRFSHSHYALRLKQRGGTSRAKCHVRRVRERPSHVSRFLCSFCITRVWNLVNS